MEQTLFICREVDIYRIPPRTGRGHISGEWKLEDKIFTARCRVISTVDDKLEIRLEDPNTADIFAACPVPRKHREAAVENAVDSSRNFALRIEDPSTGRHAFLGMSFAERSNAFDFNVALTDFEKQLLRQEDLKAASTGAAQAIAPEAASLYRHENLQLRDGQSITVEVKKKASLHGEEKQSSFLSRLAVDSWQTAGIDTAAHAVGPLLPPPPSASMQQRTTAVGNQQKEAEIVAKSEEDWATF